VQGTLRRLACSLRVLLLLLLLLSTSTPTYLLKLLHDYELLFVTIITSHDWNMVGGNIGTTMVIVIHLKVLSLIILRSTSHDEELSEVGNSIEVLLHGLKACL
jgi:hypothetical protein